MDESVLQGIGLTRGESRVYLALLSLGETTTGPIVRESGISASKVYKVLGRLSKKGLASHIVRERTKYFSAASPDRLLDYLQEKEVVLRREKATIEKILPELKKKAASQQREQSVSVFEGLEGIKTTRMQSLEKLSAGDSLNILGASKKSIDTLHGFWDYYHKIRAKKGIKTRFLFDRTAPDSYVKSRLAFPHTESKRLPTNMVTPAATLTYKDFVEFLIVETEKPVAILIKNKKIADSFNQYFNSLWNQSWTYFEGEQGVQEYNEYVLGLLKKGQSWAVVNATGPTASLEAKIREYHKIREQKGIRFRIIYSEEQHAVIKERSKYKFSQVKVLPKRFIAPGAIHTFPGHMAILMWKKHPRVFMIKDKEIHASFQNYFDVLWKLAQKPKP